MKILVLGCAGYIGSKLVPALLKFEQSVHGVDNLIYHQKSIPLHWMDNPDFSFAYSDVRNFQYNLNKYDIIINLAAIVGAPAARKNPELSNSINKDFVKILTKRLSPSQRLIQMTSTSGYGTGHCDESSPLNPLSLYGKQKVEAEKYVLDHYNSVSLRLATVMGVSPRMRFDLLVNYFVQELWFNDKITVFEPEFKRNFVHINDVVNTIIRMSNMAVDGIFNVGHPSGNFTKLDLLGKIISVMYGKNKSYIPEIKIATGKDEDQRNCTISSAKIEKYIQFHYDLEYGVQELLNIMPFITQKDIKTMNNTWIYDYN